MKKICLILACSGQVYTAKAQLDDKTVVKPALAKVWQTFPLHNTRLLPGSPFYTAMQTDQRYLLGMDVERMLNSYRRRVRIPEKGAYPGSNQPAGTRPGDMAKRPGIPSIYW